MISVCIATYNGEEYIEAQLSSILIQLGDEDEIIISDDNSTDNTMAIINSINDDRIKIISHSKSYKYDNIFDYTTHNFENALLQCHGDIIFLSDQDDIWMPYKVQIMCAYLTNYHLVVSDAKVVDSNLKTICASYLKEIGINTGMLANIIKCRYLGSCMAFNRILLKHILPFPKSYVPHDLWIGLIAKYFYSVTFCPQPLILYRRHKKTVSSAANRSTSSLIFKIKYRLYTIYYLLKNIIFSKEHENTSSR